MRVTRLFGRRSAAWGLSTLAALSPLAAPASAREPVDDIQVSASLTETSQISPGSRGDLEGTARLQVEVSFAQAVSNIEARVARPSRASAQRVVAAGTRWSLPDGMPSTELASGRASRAAGGTLIALVEVPVSGKGVHDLVVEVSGTGAEGNVVRGEAFVRVPLGVPLPSVADDGEVALLPMAVQP
jgi:hypothetical protein